ncbi:MAG TPA: hypothetical protein VNF02_02825 [Candidatus Limnocylindrales bacterium]|nr:hypothetical protein [Candidatus Limnocylindrales bacterium]
MTVTTSKFPGRGVRPRSTTAHKPQRQLSDDEILGLVTTVQRPGDQAHADAGNAVLGRNQNGRFGHGSSNAPQSDADAEATGHDEDSSANDNQAAADGDAIPSALAKVIDANPQLRQLFDEAQAYRAVFASPDAARDAKNQLDELDGMFFSAQPADHAALAARIHELSPDAFHSFARAVQAHAAKVSGSNHQTPGAAQSPPPAHMAPDASRGTHAGNSSDGSSPDGASQSGAPSVSAADGQGYSAPAAPVSGVNGTAPMSSTVASPAQHAASAQIDPHHAAQAAFFHDTNAAAVEQILGTIHSQVNRLLPDSVPSGTRNRIVGEIYRELDTTLRANRQLGKQLREAFQAGAGDAAHQRAIVTLVAGRAKQALPSVAKRVIGEWTQSIVAANRERLSRREAASKRVDIAGAGSSNGVNRKPISPRDVDYRRLSDADILNL